jgi:hypothetical protein
MLWLSVALAAVAVVLPISTVSDLIKPDERLVARAVARGRSPALPRRAQDVGGARSGPRRGRFALHCVEYVQVGSGSPGGRPSARRLVESVSTPPGGSGRP